MKNILILGSESFLAKNLLSEIHKKKYNIYLINKKNNNKIEEYINKCSYIFHFVGKNRSNKNLDFIKTNDFFTKKIFYLLTKVKTKKKLIYISTNKVNQKNFYGITKKNAEKHLFKLKNVKKIDLKILRLPNVFGKWSKPNYNSVFATFCYNISRNKKIKIQNNFIKCIHINDVTSLLKNFINSKIKPGVKIYRKFDNEYFVSVSKIASLIKKFTKNKYEFLLCNNEFQKKLYSTFLYFRPINKCLTKINSKKDSRGRFCEFLRSISYGQISYFDINPGQERGSHYHNYKWEKFFLIKGRCEYITRDLYSKKVSKFTLDENHFNTIDSIPGYIHKIKNLTKEKSFFLVWSNENFNFKKPDTYHEKI